jgi:hypothetical protein
MSCNLRAVAIRAKSFPEKSHQISLNLFTNTLKLFLFTCSRFSFFGRQTTLDNEILISLVGEYFQPQCTQSMGKEIIKRLGNSDFSVSELSLLSNALVSFHTELDYLVKHIWDHYD